jgi:hypothetical protein
MDTFYFVSTVFFFLTSINSLFMLSPPSLLSAVFHSNGFHICLLCSCLPPLLLYPSISSHIKPQCLFELLNIRKYRVNFLTLSLLYGNVKVCSNHFKSNGYRGILSTGVKRGRGHPHLMPKSRMRNYTSSPSCRLHDGNETVLFVLYFMRTTCPTHRILPDLITIKFR